MSKDRPRILVARFALDGHDRGILTIMNALRDAGMEVIYIRFTNPNEIVKSAIEEDVDMIAITSSLGQHLLVSSRLLKELEKSETHIPVIIGGVIPGTDVPKLLDLGVKNVFGPGSTPREAVSFIYQTVRQSGLEGIGEPQR